MNRRGMETGQIEGIIKNPQQEIPSSSGRVILQNIVHDDFDGKKMLFRVIGIRNSDGFKVITAYKTSKIEKHWKEALQ